MGNQLAGQNAFVTGGGSGIGFACARAFAADGANVLIMGRNAGKLESAAEEIRALAPGVTVQIHAGDVGNEAAVEAFRAGEIRFPEIVEVTEQALRRHQWKDNPSLDDLLAADRWARNEVAECTAC